MTLDGGRPGTGGWRWWPLDSLLQVPSGHLGCARTHAHTQAYEAVGPGHVHCWAHGTRLAHGWEVSPVTSHVFVLVFSFLLVSQNGPKEKRVKCQSGARSRGPEPRRRVIGPCPHCYRQEGSGPAGRGRPSSNTSVWSQQSSQGRQRANTTRPAGQQSRAETTQSLLTYLLCLEVQPSQGVVLTRAGR